MTERTVKVRYAAVIDPYISGVKRMQAETEAFAKTAEKTAAQARGQERSWANATSAAQGLALAAGTLAGVGLVTILQDSVKAASDLEQTLMKTNVVFGRGALDIERWASTAAESFGLSKQAALEASASFGDMFSQLGFTSDEARGMSKQVVQLAADLGSFNNLPTADVLQRISAGFRGEYDSLQRLIPNISAARVEQEALATTGKSSAKQLTAQEKAAATLAIVMKDGARAQGDFARSAGTLAVEQQKLNARWEDARAALGTALLPVLSQLAKVASGVLSAVTPLIQAFTDLPGPVQAAVASLIGFRLLHGQIAATGASARSTIQSLGEAFAYAGQAADRAGGGLKGFHAGVSTFVGGSAGIKSAASGLLGVLGGPWGLAFTGATAALGAWMSKQAEAKQRVDALSETLDRQTGTITDNTRAMVAKRLQDEGVFELARKVGVSLADVTDAAVGNAEALGRVNAALSAYREEATFEGATSNAEDLRSALGGVSAETAEAIAKHKQLTEAVGKTGDSLTAGADSSRTAATGLSGISRSAADARSELDKLIDSLSTYGQGAADSREAARRFEESIDAAGEALKNAREEFAKEAKAKGLGKKATEDYIASQIAAGRALDVGTAAGRRAQAALDDIRDSGLKVAEQMLKQGESTDAAAASVERARAQFIDMAVSLGMSRTKAAELADQMGLSRRSVEGLAEQIRQLPAVKVVAETAEARSRIEAIQTMLNSLKAKPVVVPVTYETYGAGLYSNKPIAEIPGHATGGRLVGPGTGTSDSILIRASNGEGIVTADAMAYYERQHGRHWIDSINAKRFATGGRVGGASTVNSTVSLPADGWSLTGKVDIGGMVVDLVDARLSRVGARAGVREF